MRTKFKIIFTALALTMFAAQAQTYNIDWFKISGGGGTSTNGQYSITGTIGQHDAGGAMTGGNYSLTGGFWSLISVVQTAGAPTLCISQSGGTVTVYWQEYFRLELAAEHESRVDQWLGRQQRRNQHQRHKLHEPDKPRG